MPFTVGQELKCGLKLTWAVLSFTKGAQLTAHDLSTLEREREREREREEVCTRKGGRARPNC
jgi:hypothetical protein